MLDSLKDWEYISFDDDDEPFFLRKVGRIKFYAIPDYLIAFDALLDRAKGIKVTGSDDLTAKLIQAVTVLKQLQPKHKQLSLL